MDSSLVTQFGLNTLDRTINFIAYHIHSILTYFHLNLLIFCTIQTYPVFILLIFTILTLRCGNFG